MSEAIESFILLLRRSGVRISPTESMDAMRAVEIVGYRSREVLEGALASALAKTADEKRIFHDTFERFFASLPIPAPGPDSIDPDPQALPEGTSPLTQMLLSGDGVGLAMAMQQAAQEAGLGSFQFRTQRGLFLQKLMRLMGFDALNRDIEGLRREETPPGSLARLDQAKQALYEEVRLFAERQFALWTPPTLERASEEYLKSTRLSSFDQHDYQNMLLIVGRMVKRLRTLYSRRRRASRLGFLDFKKTFRDNIHNQGVLFQLHWKKKRLDRPDVVAICDISRSVKHVSKFFLLFLYSLNEVLARIRTFAFCSSLVEVSRIFDEYPIEEAIARIVTGAELPVAMGLTDYARALQDFKEAHLQGVSRRTTIFILGDARNNHDDPKAELLRLIRQKCRKIIWLNPENPALWGTGDSAMRSYLPHCDLARECNTLKHLEKVGNILLRA